MYSIQNIPRKYSFPHAAVIFPTCSSKFYKEKHTFGTIFSKKISFFCYKRKSCALLKVKSKQKMSKNYLTIAYQKLQQRLQFGILHSGEDALNDAFCQLWAGQYDPATEADGEKLLRTAVRHRQISLWREENRHPQTSIEKTNLVQPPPDTDAQETFLQVKKLIETQLTPLQKDILTRHDINDDTYKEIAQALGMQEAAVRMQLSRARNIIRETYKKTKR